MIPSFILCTYIDIPQMLSFIFLFFSYFYLVDSLRRAPSSYISLQYHSQITYRLLTNNDTSVLVKFRLLSSENPDMESGRLVIYMQLFFTSKNLNIMLLGIQL